MSPPTIPCPTGLPGHKAHRMVGPFGEYWCPKCQHAYAVPIWPPPDAPQASPRPDHPRAPEKVLQTQVESLLERSGFRRMTPENHARYADDPATVGFYGHIPGKRASGIPQLPDIFAFARQNDRPPLLVELKTRDDYRVGQREAIAGGCWQLARSYDEFADLLREWFDSTGPGSPA